jgi:tagatose-6-phosphate ketose/aldose isomerase
MDELSKILALPEAERSGMGAVHTPREISQQPDTWLTTHRIVGEQLGAARSFLEAAGVRSGGGARPAVFLVGAGTSDYIGRSLAALLRRKWGYAAQAVPSTDLLTCMEDFVPPDTPHLWISFSRSGDSSEGVAVIEEALARHPAARHLIVTCNGNGRMARDFAGLDNVCPIVLDDAVNDRGLAMTSSFTNMVVAGQCLAHAFEPGAYRPILDELVAAARDLLPRAAEAAARLVDGGFSKVCFLGTGPLAGAAVESGLKVLELTAGRIVTFSESFLGVRHGPLSAIDDDTLLVAYLSSDPRRRAYESDLLAEVAAKRLAKKVVLAGPAAGDAREPGAEALSWSFAPEGGDYYCPPLAVIFGQLLGLFASLSLGLEPDTPSPSGAISRVVTQVRIH